MKQPPWSSLGWTLCSWQGSPRSPCSARSCPGSPCSPFRPNYDTHFWSPSLEHHSFCHISYASGFSKRRSLSIVFRPFFPRLPSICPNKQPTNNFGFHSLKIYFAILSRWNGWMRLVYSGLLLFIGAWNWRVGEEELVLFRFNKSDWAQIRGVGYNLIALSHWQKNMFQNNSISYLHSNFLNARDSSWEVQRKRPLDLLSCFLFLGPVHFFFFFLDLLSFFFFFFSKGGRQLWSWHVSL